MIEETLYSTLTGNATVAAIVGTRVYPAPAQQNATYPFVVYDRIGGPRDISLPGASGTGRFRMRIDCWADNKRGRRTLMAAVMAALDALSGAVAAIEPVNFYDDEAEVYRASIDYYIHHSEA